MIVVVVVVVLVSVAVVVAAMVSPTLYTRVIVASFEALSKGFLNG